MAYTDLLNEAIDDLTASLTAVSGLRVINDATKIVPNCVFIEPPSFTTIAGNGNVIRMDFPVRVIGSGPAGLPVLQKILSIAAAVLASPIIVMAGRPSSLEIGGAL
jgi:threonine dehydrogenase-like Zn-dependent dehydrogenase